MHYSVHERAQDVAPGEAWSYVLCLRFKRNIFLISCRSDDPVLPAPGGSSTSTLSGSKHRSRRRRGPSTPRLDVPGDYMSTCSKGYASTACLSVRTGRSGLASWIRNRDAHDFPILCPFNGYPKFDNSERTGLPSQAGSLSPPIAPRKCVLATRLVHTLQPL